MFMAAGYATIQGSKALKHKVERRKNSKLDGDFIVTSSDPTKNRRRRYLPNSQDVRNSFSDAKETVTNHTKVVRQSIQRIRSSVSSKGGEGSAAEEEEGEEEERTSTQQPSSEAGEEIELQNMEDIRLNGTRALILSGESTKGGGGGFWVQFLIQKDGYDNYHESGILIQPENIVRLSSASSPEPESEEEGEEKEQQDEQIIIQQDNQIQQQNGEKEEASTIPNVGTIIELHSLEAIHMNGLRGIVVEQPTDKKIKEGRIPIQLLLEEEQGGEGGALISVKAENCRIICIQNIIQLQQQQQPTSEQPQPQPQPRPVPELRRHEQQQKQKQQSLSSIDSPSPPSSHPIFPPDDINWLED